MKNIFLLLRYNIPIHFIFFLTSWLPDNRISVRVRGILASFFINNCGKNFTIGRNVTLLNSYNLSIGNNVYIATGCWINAMAGLEIEDEVVFGPYVVISTLQHNFKNNSIRFGGSTLEKVKIGKGSWLAAHSSIKCGVNIGKGNLIAANAFVTKNTADYKIYGGVPAVEIKEIENNEGNAEVIYKRK